jgi:branched-chain amino acid transport system substrate-binding protein
MVVRRRNRALLFLVVAVLVAGLLIVAGGCSKPAAQSEKQQAAGQSRDYILIGEVVPLTGFLAAFGEGTPTVENKLIDQINQNGGIYIKEYGKKVPIKLTVADSQSDPTKASEAATKLVVQDKVDLLVTMHTPLTVNPVSAVAERYKIPCISTEDPVEIWLSGGTHYWSFHSAFMVADLAKVYVDMWDQMNTNKKVGLMCDNQDGAAMHDPIKNEAQARGYTVVDPGMFPAGTKDYTSIINQFKQAGVEIVTGNMNTPDFATAWQQFHQQGFVPKVMTMSRAILFPANIAALGGDLGEGLTTEVWWSENHPFKSSLTGEGAGDLCKWYQATTSKQPSAVLGFKYALMEITIDALNRAQTLNREQLREAIKATNLDTIIGHIQYNDKNYCATPLVGGQWQKGTAWPWEMNIISNKRATMIPLGKSPMIPVPGSK